MVALDSDSVVRSVPARSAGIRPAWWAVSIAVTFAALAAALGQIDTTALKTVTHRISLAQIALVCLALACGAMLASIRLRMIAADVGRHLSLRESVAALSIGQIAGAVLFQFFGQVAARSAYLAPRGISVPANVVIAVYERAIAFGVSLALAVAGGWFLFGRVVLDTAQGGGQFLKILAGITVAILAGAFFAWGRLALVSIRPFANRRAALTVVRNIALTLGIQLSTAAAYVMAVKSFVPAIDTLDVIAASAVVMFAASLPISLAGWGVRELSAVLALSVIGVPSVAALAVSVMVGAVSLLVVVVLAAAAVAMSRNAVATPAFRVRGRETEIDLESMAFTVLPLAAATAVFFQIHVPSTFGHLNINLADPISVLAGLMFLLIYFRTGRPQWRVPGFDASILAATAVVIASALHGYFSFGWSDWAFTGKLAGWFVLLGYGAAGALIVRAAGLDGLRILLATFAAVAAGLVLFELSLVCVKLMGFEIPSYVAQLPVSGFSQNRNAFGFLLLLVVCSLPLLPARGRAWLLSVMLLGAWFSGSRAIAGAMAIIIGLTIIFGALRVRQLVAAGAVAIATVLAIAAMPLLGQLWQGEGTAPANQSVWLIAGLADMSNVQRLQSVVGGLTLFAGNPLFGAGLGAYMEAQLRLNDPLVIHSTPVWLLAEMGLVGAAVIAWPFVRAFLTELRRIADPVAVFLVLVILAFGIVCQVHEILYQRAFWLLLGAGLACMPRVAHSPAAARAANGNGFSLNSNESPLSLKLSATTERR